MAYQGVDRKRFAQLLEWGVDDGELRRFFEQSRVQLILKGARVQNLPRGKAARVRVLAQELPGTTDGVVREWFGRNLTMIDPETAADAVATLRTYEANGEGIPEDQAKRLARSCLVHLFSAEPPQELVSFLRPAKEGGQSTTAEPFGDEKPPEARQDTQELSEALAHALIALMEAKDPDEWLSTLPARRQLS